jgi:hypothetical protein
MTLRLVGWRWHSSVGAMVAALVAAVHGWSLLRFPAPFVDEAWFAARAWALVCGRTYSSLDMGVIDQFRGGWYFFPLLPNLAYAGALAMAQSPSLLAVRLVSLTAGVLLVVVAWRAAHASGDRIAAWLAAGLVSTSATFFFSAHMARYDILAAAMAYLGVSIYFHRQQGERWAMFVAGLCAAAALEMHPFAAVVLGGLGAAILYDVWGRRTTLPEVAIFAVGGALVAFLWIGIHVLPDISTFVSLQKLLFVPTHAPTQGRSIAETARGLGDTLLLLGAAYGFASLVIAAGLIIALASSEYRLRRAGIMAAVTVLGFAILVRNRNFMYLIEITPALDICAAAALADVWKRARRRPEWLVAGAAFATVVVVHTLARNVQLLYPNRSAAFARVEQRIGASIRPGDTIIGSQTYWFGLAAHQYYSWEQLVYLRRYRPGTSATQALASLRPTVLIRDAHWDQFILDEPGPSLYQRLLRVPKTELETWLSAHAVLVDDFDGEGYGRVRVYRLRQ